MADDIDARADEIAFEVRDYHYASYDDFAFEIGGKEAKEVIATALRAEREKALREAAAVCRDLSELVAKEIDSPFGNIAVAAAVSRNAYDNSERSILGRIDKPASPA